MALRIQETAWAEDPGVNQKAVKKGSWKADLKNKLKHCMKRLSPISCLSGVRDCYVDSMLQVSEHVDGAALIQGPHMASPLRSPCREGLRRDEDDMSFYLALALCKQQAELNPSYGSGPIFAAQKQHSIILSKAQHGGMISAWDKQFQKI